MRDHRRHIDELGAIEVAPLSIMRCTGLWYPGLVFGSAAAIAMRVLSQSPWLPVFGLVLVAGLLGLAGPASLHGRRRVARVAYLLSGGLLATAILSGTYAELHSMPAATLAGLLGAGLVLLPIRRPVVAELRARAGAGRHVVAGKVLHLPIWGLAPTSPGSEAA